jgi:hypothetical protein
MAKDATIVIRGTVDWAKIVGKARPYTGNPKYDKGPYWSVDITPDKKSRELIKANGITEKLRKPKENDSRKETYISLKVLENRADGEKNDPPKISDIRGQAWDNRLLGNGTAMDIKVKIKDYGSGSEKGVYYQAGRVLKLVPYEGGGFEALSEDDEYFAAGEDASDVDTSAASASPSADDLDDDIPF